MRQRPVAAGDGDGVTAFPTKGVDFMAKKTGVPTLQKVALRMCSLLNRFGSTIVILYPTNTALHAALAAAKAACSELELELAQVRELGD